jgi:hypothetical protein
MSSASASGTGRRALLARSAGLAAIAAAGGVAGSAFGPVTSAAAATSATFGESIYLTPSGDTTGATDVAAINDAFSSYVDVVLLPGTYYIDGPITVPSGVTFGSFTPAAGNPIANYGKGPLPLTAAVIEGTSGFSGTAMIELSSAGSQAGGSNILGIALDGSSLASGTSVHGIEITGAVANCLLRDVTIYKPTGDGVHMASNSDGNPDQWDVERIGVHAAGNIGVNLTTGVADSTWLNCWVSTSASHNWAITNGTDSYFIRCRGENSVAGAGFSLTAYSGFTGFVTFLACETTGNETAGFTLGGAGAGQWNLAWCRAGDDTEWSFSGTGDPVVNSPAAFNTSRTAPTFT